MSEYPKTVTSYQTSDGELWTSLSVAIERQRCLDGAKLATQLLKQGHNLHQAMVTAGLLDAESHRELIEVNQDTKLVISHWQCRDEPGYRPVEVSHTGMIYVHGHAGSWSGPYGSWCWPKEVVNYWKDTKARAERTALGSRSAP